MKVKLLHAIAKDCASGPSTVKYSWTESKQDI